ncbi:hypothetical protein ACFODT_15085 [Vibrio zhugei]|uniref:Uncharacterized protein n=1 Tax=Vibrio zhugei TaxID=2479546 RepID=A0ABV7CE95_9VIBR|nr:hypothetical protein [Vibrio zhugei]
MKSPLQKIKDWYLSLPIDHRIDIGAIIGMSCPGFGDLGISTETDLIPEKFIAPIDEALSHPATEVGMVLLLREAIPFYFISKRDDQSGWKESKAMMQELADKHDSETFQRSANSMDFRAKQWLSTCEKWNDIKDCLTNEYLNQYSNPFRN